MVFPEQHLQDTPVRNVFSPVCATGQYTDSGDRGSVWPGWVRAWPLEKEGQGIVTSRLTESVSDEEGWVQLLL